MKLLKFLFDSIIPIEKSKSFSSFFNISRVHVLNLEQSLKAKFNYREKFKSGDRIKIVRPSRIFNPYINNTGELATVEAGGPIWLYVKTDGGGCGNIDIVAAEKI